MQSPIMNKRTLRRELTFPFLVPNQKPQSFQTLLHSISEEKLTSSAPVTPETVQRIRPQIVRSPSLSTINEA